MTPELKKLAEKIAPINLENLSELNISGVYAFWWNDDISILKELNLDIHFQGKAVTNKERNTDSTLGKYIIHESQWKLVPEEPVCLYVGKATDISKRIRQHLAIRKADVDWYSPHDIVRNGKRLRVEPDIQKHFLVKRTSSCQLRAGIEHLFKNKTRSSLEEKLKHFGISFYPETDFSNRFYLEDLAIGYYRPWFNLDSER